MVEIAVTANIIVEHRLIADPTVVQFLTDIRSIVMATQQELTTRLNDMSARLDNLGTQLDKAKGEITAATAEAAAQIQALKDQLANAGDIPPDIIASVDKLDVSIGKIGTSAQALDDLNTDTPSP